MSTNKDIPMNEHDPTKIPTPLELREQLAKNINSQEQPDTSPKGWSRRSVAAYYTYNYAVQAKALIDQLFADRDVDILIDTRKHRVSIATAKMQFWQGWQWIREQWPDPEVRAKYTEIYTQNLIASHQEGRTVRLYIKETTTQELLSATTTVRSFNKKLDSNVKWKGRLDQWLESERKDGDTFRIEREHLTDIDLEYIDTLVGQLDNLVITKRGPNLVAIVHIEIPTEQP